VTGKIEHPELGKLAEAIGHLSELRSERWNEFELPKLSLRELLVLARLLG
jgi:hypothetical protein